MKNLEDYDLSKYMVEEARVEEVREETNNKIKRTVLRVLKFILLGL